MRCLANVLLAIVLHVDLPAQAPAGMPRQFDVASVKTNTTEDLAHNFAEPPIDGYRQTNLSLANYVMYAFNIRSPLRMDGLPEWTRRERFDITGKGAGPLTEGDRRAMLRDVLISRFQLIAPVEPREQRIYVLTKRRPQAPLGPGLKPRPDCATAPCDSGGTGRPDGLRIRATTLTQLADGMLSSLTGQVVRDETGIPGIFDVDMSWRPDSAAGASTDPRPSMFTAVDEQLGLRLDARRGPVDVLVVDHIERPSPD